MDCSLLRLLQYALAVLLRESSPDGTGLLWSEVERKVLLVLVEETQLSALVGVDDGQDLSDGFADIVAASGQYSLSCVIFIIPPLGRRPSSINIHRKGEEWVTHILVSFEADPPAIFCVRS